ncbi:hypothetical protein [Acidocella sp.]|uniref:hypothetical protein n=1 Tax=Acidocella sp. TaxID=50710 RepID=UPI00261188E0|nr:hypothetical protein [Acidocella sp.]
MMTKEARLRAGDAATALLAAMVGGGFFLFRYFLIVPRATVGICAAQTPPLYCVPRLWVLKAQIFGLFGWVALALGILAFISGKRPFAGLALGAGIAAVVNYNGTAGIIGADLGIAAWGSLLARRPGWG